MDGWNGVVVVVMKEYEQQQRDTRDPQDEPQRAELSGTLARSSCLLVHGPYDQGFSGQIKVSPGSSGFLRADLCFSGQLWVSPGRSGFLRAEISS